MESCKYHPDVPSIFTCEVCNTNLCSDCVDHSVANEARCFGCGELLSVRVTADSVEPFAKRLEKAFRYPLTSSAMSFIVGLSVFTTILAALPLGMLLKVLAFIFCTGLAVNYSFLCLKATAEGDMQPPNLGEAIIGSLSILVRLLIMSVVIGATLYGIAVKVSPLLATLITIVLFIGFPAIMMAFAMTDSIFAAINPLTFIRLMATVGVPYFVLVMFLFIMVSSVSLLSSIVGDDLLALSAIIQSSISYYYAMVAFHLMGYLLYQYQDKLGIGGNDNEALMPRLPATEVAMAHANIRLKEGDYDRAVELLRNAVEQEPKNPRLWQRFFDLLYRLGNKEVLSKVADRYLSHLFETAQSVRLLPEFRKIQELVHDYRPDSPYLRYQLATEYHAIGDAKSSALMLNGLHKQHPDFEQLIPAYELMAQALREIPSMAAQAAKCQQLLVHLKTTKPTATTSAPNRNTKADFSQAAEPTPAIGITDVQSDAKPKDDDDRDKPIEFSSF